MKSEELYKKNLAIMKEKRPELLNKVLKGQREESGISVEELPCRNGNIVPIVKMSDGKQLVINGIYGEEERIEQKLKEWGKLPQNMPLFFYGLANFGIMKRVHEELKDNCIVFVYEPSVEIFDYYLYRIDLEEIFEEWSLHIEVGEYKDQNFKRIFGSLFQIDTVSLFKLEIAPNYNQLFPENLKRTLELGNKVLSENLVNWATMERYTDVVGSNILNNIHHLFHGYGVGQLAGMLKHKVPAIVVSAGPSLNKNINDLKAAVGKACIIAVDTAIKPLLNHGIVPHFFVIVDGLKPTNLMDHPMVSEIPMVTCVIVADGIMNLHNGKKFFYTAEAEPEVSVWDKCGAQAVNKKEIARVGLASGGSVANSAFSLARLMDAKEIILVGQDLALKNNRTHADGTFQEKMGRAKEEVLAKTFLVDGIRGNKVQTLPDFETYLRWFEEIIKVNEMKNVIDATQGGARIHGTKLMTLKKAIQKYCTEEYDVKSMIDKLPEMMDYSAKCEFLKQYNDLPEGLDLVEKNAKKAVRLYRKMHKISDQEGELDTEALNRIVAKIKKLNEFMNDDMCALFVQGTLERINFIMRVGAYEESEDERENIKLMAREGVTMNYYIMLHAQMLKKQAEEILDQYKPIIAEEDTFYPIDKLVKQLREREESTWN